MDELHELVTVLQQALDAAEVERDKLRRATGEVSRVVVQLQRQTARMNVLVEDAVTCLTGITSLGIERD